MSALVVAVAFLVPELVHAQETIENRLAPEQPLVVIAHRAVGGGAPDNSLAGIQYAIDRGIDMVEVDVQRTHGGGYVLMHDASLRTTTNAADVFPDGSPQRDPGDAGARQYLVWDNTLEDITRLRLRDPQGGDHPVPTLDDALDLASGRLLMILELKNWVVESLVARLKRHDTRNVLFFSQTDLRKLRDTAGAAGIGAFANLSSARDKSAALEKARAFYGPLLKMVSVSSSTLTREFVGEAEAHGVWVEVDARFSEVLQSDGAMAPWLETTLDSGAAAVMTRNPDELLEALGR